MVSSLLIALLPLLISAEDKEHSYRLVSCMQIVHTQLASSQEQFEYLVSQSSFKREEVLTKYMGTMIAYCMKHIPMDACGEIISEREGDTAARRHIEYAPMPDNEISSEEDLQLTADEEELLAEIMERTKKAEEMKARGEMPESEYQQQSSQPIGTSLGLIYILGVFMVFAGIVIYGIKRLNDRELSKKDKKKKKA